MKSIAVFKAGDVRIVDDVPKPQCGDYEALVKVHFCGFCNGTDFQIINETMSKDEGLGDYPTLLGHEGSGVVVETGSKVRYIKTGDRFIHPNLRIDPGNGYTRTYGGMSDYGLVADHKAMLEDGYPVEKLPFYKKFQKIPDDFDLQDGAMLLSLSESLSAVKNFGIDHTKRVLLFGAGPMGLSVAKYSGIFGAKDLTVVDTQCDRLELAVNLSGAKRTVNISEVALEEALDGELFDIAIDAVGLSSVLIQASHFVKPYGKVCSMGVLKKTDSCVDLSKIKNNTSVHMLNFPYGEYDVMEENIRYIQEGKIDPKDFYSHVINRSEIHRAMDLVRKKEALKVILQIVD